MLKVKGRENYFRAQAGDKDIDKITENLLESVRNADEGNITPNHPIF